jgi:hypothetical protein
MWHYIFMLYNKGVAIWQMSHSKQTHNSSYSIHADEAATSGGKTLEINNTFLPLL